MSPQRLYRSTYLRSSIKINAQRRTSAQQSLAGRIREPWPKRTRFGLVTVKLECGQWRWLTRECRLAQVKGCCTQRSFIRIMDYSVGFSALGVVLAMFLAS